MTYCVGLYLEEGLVMLSDTRTSAGVDNISSFRKMHVWEVPGDRVLVLLTAGNLAVSQAAISQLEEGLAADETGGVETLLSVPSMFRAARLVGRAIREVWKADAPALEAQDAPFNVSMILGGQIKGGPPALFNVYSAGNFIQATPDTPYFQIGEHKYGKPILDRAVDFHTDLESACKLGLLSMDSTVRSNLSVGFPIDVLAFRRDAFRIALARRVEASDPYFQEMSENWSQSLKAAYQAIPAPPWRWMDSDGDDA